MLGGGYLGAWYLGGVVPAGSGGGTVTGTGSSALAPISVSGAGTETFTGTGTVVLAPVALSGTGTWPLRLGHRHVGGSADASWGMGRRMRDRRLWGHSGTWRLHGVGGPRIPGRVRVGHRRRRHHRRLGTMRTSARGAAVMAGSQPDQRGDRHDARGQPVPCR